VTPASRENTVISAGSIFRGIVLRHIMTEIGDKAEMKARLMIAREHGHIDDEAVEDIILFYGLEAA
jgi:hypothetical protein